MQIPFWTRVLITIDEVQHDNNMKIFASQFQIFVRQDYPVFLIMTGLVENIKDIQNDPALTFLLRSPKIKTGPLSIIQIVNHYMSIFEIDDDKANKLAHLTKGYAFAFQALGVAYWDNKDFKDVLVQYDFLLDDYVYKKIWTSLTTKEREIVLAISSEEVKIGDICKSTGITSGTLSKYKDNLVIKGIIDNSKYGYVSLALPRFYEIAKYYRI